MSTPGRRANGMVADAAARSELTGRGAPLCCRPARDGAALTGQRRAPMLPNRQRDGALRWGVEAAGRGVAPGAAIAGASDG